MPSPRILAALCLVGLATDACGQDRRGSTDTGNATGTSQPTQSPLPPGNSYVPDTGTTGAAAPTATPPYDAPATPGPRREGGGGRTMNRDQFMQRGRAKLMSFDTNHDGKLSLAEYSARFAGQGPAANGRPRDPARSFNRFDTNHDGVLDAGEMDAILARQFAKRAANGDVGAASGERGAPQREQTPQ